MDLFEIVSNRPLEELRDGPMHCPFCQSDEVAEVMTSKTLVGYSGEDFNHWHTYCVCLACNERFCRESKGPRNVWYTQKDGTVLEGVPCCFESYKYKCLKCGGVVERYYTDLEGKPVVFTTISNVDGEWVKQYKTFYRCNDCGYGGETEEDYYEGDMTNWRKSDAP